MTRQHVSRYQKPADMYAAHRCVNCPHIFYRDDKPGDPCRYTAEGLCTCTDHRSEEASDGA